VAEVSPEGEGAAEEIRTIRWGAEPEFFGPRHEFREDLLEEAVAGWDPGSGWIADAAAGLGTMTRRLAGRGFRVVAVDRSIDSLLHHVRAARASGIAGRTPALLADVLRLPFRDGALAGLVTAETIEHLDDDETAAREIARVVRPGGGVAVSTPANPSLWSEWDVWAEHRRRYRREGLVALFERAGFERSDCRAFGFPTVRIYDALFLGRLIRKRARPAIPSGGDAGRGAGIVGFALRAGRSRLAVAAVKALFQVDRLFARSSLGVGWTLSARRRGSG
jgi:SAM-dependent methyltransferase